MSAKRCYFPELSPKKLRQRRILEEILLSIDDYMVCIGHESLDLEDDYEKFVKELKQAIKRGW